MTAPKSAKLRPIGSLVKKPKVDANGNAIAKRRTRPGVQALRDIRKEQKSSHLKNALAWAPFKRLVYEIASNHKSDIRFKRGAVDMLREESEAMLTRLFNCANSVAADIGGRSTLHAVDLRTVYALLERPDMYNAGIIKAHGSLAKSVDFSS